MQKLFRNIRGDLTGGLTAGVIALPLALAFGVTSGLGPSAGLYGAIFIGFFASLLGGTPTQISGPTAPMTAVSMVVIAGLLASYDGDAERAVPVIMAVFLLAGIIQVVLGLMGVGKYIRYIPYPVVSGFMTAIGLIILVTQFLPATGYSPAEDREFVATFRAEARTVLIEGMFRDAREDGTLTLNELTQLQQQADAITEEQIAREAASLAQKEAAGVIGTLRMVPRAISHVQLVELLLTIGTVVLIYFLKWLSKKLPSALITLVAITAVAHFAGLDYTPIEAIPAGLPMPILGITDAFRVSALSPFVFTALTLALLGAIDSLLTSVVADNLTKMRHKPNRELIGQGVGNSLAAFFGGIPGAGATIRTVVNIQNGGTTRLSGMIAALLLVVMLLGIGPIVSLIPSAALAGILITVGIGVMDYKGLRTLPYLPRDLKVGPFKVSSEVLTMLVVLLLSVFWNLIYAVGIGLILASLMFMRSIGELTARRSIVEVMKESNWPDEAGFPPAMRQSVYIKHVRGPLFFGSTAPFKQLPSQLPTSTQVVVLRLERMAYIDQSGLYALEEVLTDLRNQQIDVLFVGLNEQPRVLLENIEVVPGLVPEAQVFRTFRQALQWLRIHV